MELVKALPASISFDMDAFEQQYLDDVLENGRARYTEVQKEVMQFLKFANKADEELCAKIRQQNNLVIDDVTTSGSTINEILRTLRIINEDNYITIFSLIGRKDLMADV